MVKKAGIIGCGNMGSALAEGVISAGVFSKDDVYVHDKDARKAADLVGRAGCVNAGLSELLESSDIFIIAVKPYNMNDLLKVVSEKAPGKPVISVAAGVRIEAIMSFLAPGTPVIRAMPNIGASIRKGVTSVSYNDPAREAGVVDITEKIFSSVGIVVEVSEKVKDIVTAVSGSGPAYIFYMAQAMIDAAVGEGMDPEHARRLVAGTVEGAGALLAACGTSPQTLIDRVATKGGTTEAALNVLNEKGFKDMIAEAVKKARSRSVEISEEDGKCS